MIESVEPVRLQLFLTRGQTEYAAALIRPYRLARDQIAFPIAEMRDFLSGGQRQLALAQRFFDPMLFGDIHGDTERARDVPGRIAHRFDASVEAAAAPRVIERGGFAGERGPHGAV